MKEKVVVFDSQIHLIIPISQLPHAPPPQYFGELPSDPEILKIAKPVWLSAKNRELVEMQLHIHDANTCDYITPATVHGEWKKKLHQGIIYSKKSYDFFPILQKLYNKPVPSSAEIRAVEQELIEEIKKNKHLPAEELYNKLVDYVKSLV